MVSKSLSKSLNGIPSRQKSAISWIDGCNDGNESRKNAGGTLKTGDAAQPGQPSVFFALHIGQKIGTFPGQRVSK